MFTKALEVAKESLNQGHTYSEYASTVKQSDLIEYIDVIIVDADAYERLNKIMKRAYLK